jgi:hypothetical protein
MVEGREDRGRGKSWKLEKKGTKEENNKEYK